MNVYLKLTFAVLLLLCSIRWTWTRRRLYWLALQLKGQFGLPFFGIAFRLLDATKVVDYMENYATKHGNLSQLWIGTKLFVYVNHPAHVEMILNSPDCIDKGESYRFIDKFIGIGLISSKSHEWKIHRKLLNPCFSYNITNQFVPIFNKHIRIMMKCLEPRCGQPAFDILHLLKNCSMDMICETTMDKRTSTQSGNDDEYFKAIEDGLATVGVRMFNPIYQPDILFRLSSYYKPMIHNHKIVLDRVQDIINQKMDVIRLTKSTAKNKGTENTKEKINFIDRVLQLSMEEKTFTQSHVISETNTVLLAGFETTATTAAFVVLMLGMYPDLQQRVFDEMMCIHLSSETDVSLNDLAHLKYLDMFIKETLRLFPSVPYLTRTASSDIKIGKHTIPKGVEFVIGVLAMHRSADNFNLGPQLFNPDNFQPENTSQRHAYSYIPFSSGPRGCIGTKYANIVIKLIIVHLLKHYRVSSKLKLDECRFRMNVTLNLLNTHLVQIHKR